MDEINVINEVFVMLMTSMFHQETPEQLCFTMIVFILLVIILMVTRRY